MVLYNHLYDHLPGVILQRIHCFQIESKLINLQYYFLLDAFLLMTRLSVTEAPFFL